MQLKAHSSFSPSFSDFFLVDIFDLGSLSSFLLLSLTFDEETELNFLLGDRLLQKTYIKLVIDKIIKESCTDRHPTKAPIYK